MDNMPTSYPLQPQPPNKKNMPVVVVILLEILFILFLLGGIFLALIFFDVLHLNTPFPSLQMNQPTTTTVTTPTFAYDRSQADGLLTSFIQGTLQPQYIPHMYQTDPNYLIQNNNTFYRYWQQGQISVKASLTYRENTNNETYLKIFLTVPYSASEAATFASSSATFLAQKYLNAPPSSDWKCSNNIICQTFTSDIQGAHGVTIRIEKETAVLYDCYLSNEVSKTQNFKACPSNF